MDGNSRSLFPAVPAVLLSWVVVASYALATPVTAVLLGVVWFGTAIPLPMERAALSLARAALVGLSSAVLWALEPGAWALATVMVGARVTLGRCTVREAIAFSTAAWVPSALWAASHAIPDAEHAVSGALQSAVRPLPIFFLRAAGLCAALWLAWRAPAVLRLRATAEHRKYAPLALGVVILGAVVPEAIRRAVNTVTEAGLPTDLRSWAEPPLLSNILKLGSGVPLYGDPARVDSFTYSPLLEVVHRALLSPFGQEREIVLHRVLVLGWQALTATAVLGALLVRARGSVRHRLALSAFGFAATLILLWSSRVSPHLHPDHAFHALVALSAAFLLARSRLPPRSVDVGLVVLPALAAAFKLTGAGLWLGFALVAILERDRRAAFLLATSLFLIALSVPIYHWLFGPFEFYAIGLMSQHRVVPARFFEALLSPYGLLFVLSALAAAATSRESPLRRDVLGLSTLSAGIWVVTALAFAKEGGSSNNLVAPVLPSLVGTLLLFGSEAKAVAGVAGAAALLGITTLLTGSGGSALAREHDVIAADHRAAVKFVRGELRAGGTPLVHSVSAWIEAGGPGVPGDALHPAIELYLARHPAFEAFLRRIESGRYSSLVTPGGAFVPTPAWYVGFARRYRAAVERSYCVVYPTRPDGRPVALDVGERILILRRRGGGEAGCGGVDAGGD